jgi:hypothetical protein
MPLYRPVIDTTYQWHMPDMTGNLMVKPEVCLAKMQAWSALTSQSKASLW